jgi:hypothetical protein
MLSINKQLKILFILSSFTLLAILIGSPKSDCLACELGEDEINGYQAFEEFEEACITYSKPWEPVPFNIDDIDFG